MLVISSDISMNRFFSLSIFGLLSLFVLTSCTNSRTQVWPEWNTSTNISESKQAQLAELFKSALANPEKKPIAERAYLDFSAGMITENFLYTALTYLTEQKKFPELFWAYKKNMIAFGESPNDTAGDYIWWLIFAYAWVNNEDCWKYVATMSGTLAWLRILNWCLDTSLFFQVLKEKNMKDIDSAKKRWELEINEDFFRSLVEWKTENCGNCTLIISWTDREQAYASVVELQEKDLKDKALTIHLKDFNILPFYDTIQSDIPNREKFDLVYDNFMLYHAVYKNSVEVCKNIKNSIISRTCEKYIGKDEWQRTTYEWYIEPYIIYSYLYEL